MYAPTDEQLKAWVKEARSMHQQTYGRLPEDGTSHVVLGDGTLSLAEWL